MPKDPEAYRRYMRDYMAKRFAAMTEEQREAARARHRELYRARRAGDSEKAKEARARKKAREWAYTQQWSEEKKEANRRRSRLRSARLRAALTADKAARGCARCGENDPACLHYHHTDPKTKAGTVSHLVIAKGGGPEAAAAEAAKCEVLCANCHAKEHRARVIEETLM